MLTWLTRKRAAEMAQRFRLIWWELSEVLLWDTVPAAVPLVTFAWYCLYMRQQLTIVTAFTTIAWLDILQMNVNYIPWIYRALINASVSYHRIQDFLLGPELQPLQSLPPGSESAVEIRHADLGWSEEGKKHRKGKNRGGGQIERGDLSSTWSMESSTPPAVLQDVNLTIKRGEFVAVVGPVGCGKSTLLSAICNGGALCTGGTVDVSTFGGQCLALVGEEPWVQNASLKDNITFGAPFDAQRFDDVIEACQLAADVAGFGTAGADAVVGERGATLSGGQRARCALARACYRKPDTQLYVLDDCLRGLDVHVSQAVFEKCLLGYLAGKTRVVATHDEKLVQAADRIILLEGGRCREVTVEEWRERAGGEEWQGSEGGAESEGSEGEGEGVSDSDEEDGRDEEVEEDDQGRDSILCV
jgi:ABC-type multidrug transport system fused ATPase/permease subunit